MDEGCWKDIGLASWVSRTLNPTSSLHTMAENPALEWNVRNMTDNHHDPQVAVTAVLSRSASLSLHHRSLVVVLVAQVALLVA